MCTVSMIGDGWSQTVPQKWMDMQLPAPMPLAPYQIPQDTTKQEVEALRKEVEALKKLLIAAKKFDEETGQPDCEMDEKVELIKKIAKLVGVDVSEVFGDGGSVL